MFAVGIGAVVGVVRLAGCAVLRLLVRGEALALALALELELELDVDCFVAVAVAVAFSPDCWPSARAIIAADRVLI